MNEFVFCADFLSSALDFLSFVLFLLFGCGFVLFGVIFSMLITKAVLGFYGQANGWACTLTAFLDQFSNQVIIAFLFLPPFPSPFCHLECVPVTQAMLMCEPHVMTLVLESLPMEVSIGTHIFLFTVA